MRIEVEKRKVNIVALCDNCKIVLTGKNRAWRAHKDQRYGIMAGFELTIYIHSNEFAREWDGSKVEGSLLGGHAELCRKCHKDLIQWYLDHLEVENPS